jgi:glycosyltransferase involved in cell wall biosynthesis
VHVLVPAGIDDPARPSGGNVYDRRVCAGLAGAGWDVREHRLPGRWPNADEAAHDALARTVAGIPDGALVLVDGLIGSAAPATLVPAADRLTLVLLVHMPLGEVPDAVEAARFRERAVLSSAAAVVTTSSWTRARLLHRYALAPDRVHVAPPGVDAADLATGSRGAGEFLCVAAVTPLKGHDVLVAALAAVADLPWRCTCVGSLDRDPSFVQQLRRRVAELGITERVAFRGPRTGAALADCYAAADLLVLASRAETYGMVVTEALARGVPVVAAAVGGIGEALGPGRDGTMPGILVAPDDPAPLAAALRSWLTDPPLRSTIRQAARDRRAQLAGWDETSAHVDQALTAVLRDTPR